MAEEVLAHAQKGADDWGFAMMLVLQASVRLWDGRVGEAIERATAAAEVFDRIDDDYGRLQSAGVLGRALTSTGRLDEARKELQVLSESEGMSPSDRERLFHGMALAGSANALGDVELAETVLGDAEVVGSSDRVVDGERAVSLALHLAQRGEPRRAREVLDRGCSAEVERGGGNATAVAAIVYAALGEIPEALAAAGRVRVDDRSTYLDRAVACMAEALALTRAGDADGAVAALEATAAAVDGTEDVLAQAVVRLAARHIGSVSGSAESAALGEEAEERLAALGVRAEGWRRLFDTALRAESVSSAAS
jgi:tetratricopeptide (TPR) repeat protein